MSAQLAPTCLRHTTRVHPTARDVSARPAEGGSVRRRSAARAQGIAAPPLRSITERTAALLPGPRPHLSQSRWSAYPLRSAAGSVDPAILHGFPRAKSQRIKRREITIPALRNMAQNRDCTRWYWCRALHGRQIACMPQARPPPARSARARSARACSRLPSSARSWARASCLWRWHCRCARVIAFAADCTLS